MSVLAASPAVVARKAVARVALVGIPAGPSIILRDCFRQFGIETVELGFDQVSRFGQEKFEGCVVSLDDKAESILHAARNSRSNRRMVIYGICNSAPEAMRFSRFGVNALLKSPVERPDALKVVRSTQLLVIHELRCYVRIPYATRVSFVAGDRNSVGTSQELSGGGMSVRSDTLPKNGVSIRVQFDLPGIPVSLNGAVCWVREADQLFGIRFHPDDAGRVHVKQWIDRYLEI